MRCRKRMLRTESATAKEGGEDQVKVDQNRDTGSAGAQQRGNDGGNDGGIVVGSQS